MKFPEKKEGLISHEELNHQAEINPSAVPEYSKTKFARLSAELEILIDVRVDFLIFLMRLYSFQMRNEKEEIEHREKKQNTDPSGFAQLNEHYAFLTLARARELNELFYKRLILQTEELQKRSDFLCKIIGGYDSLMKVIQENREQIINSTQSTIQILNFNNMPSLISNEKEELREQLIQNIRSHQVQFKNDTTMTAELFIENIFNVKHGSEIFSEFNRTISDRLKNHINKDNIIAPMYSKAKHEEAKTKKNIIDGALNSCRGAIQGGPYESPDEIQRSLEKAEKCLKMQPPIPPRDIQSKIEKALKEIDKEKNSLVMRENITNNNNKKSQNENSALDISLDCQKVPTKIFLPDSSNLNLLVEIAKDNSGNNQNYSALEPQNEEKYMSFQINDDDDNEEKSDQEDHRFHP